LVGINTKTTLYGLGGGGIWGGVNTHSLKSFIESGTQGMLAIIPCRIYVFWYSLQKYKDLNKHNYNFAVVLYRFENWSHSEGGIQAENV